MPPLPCTWSIQEPEAAVWLFSLPPDEDRRALGRRLVRAVLSAATGAGTRPEEWRFARGPFGRPRVAGPFPDCVRFSVSYGDDAVAVAVSERHDVGVDIEPLVPVRLAEIPWSELSAAERARIRRTPAHGRYACFAQMWTLKEAFTKCTGEGAFRAFSTVETTLAPPGIVGGASFRLRQEEVSADGRRHALALCTRAAGSARPSRAC